MITYTLEDIKTIGLKKPLDRYRNTLGEQQHTGRIFQPAILDFSYSQRTTKYNIYREGMTLNKSINQQSRLPQST